MMRIGPIQLSIPFCQAGLAGYSDRAMRLVARRRGCPYAVTEALLDTIMLSGGQGLKKSIDINDEDHPVAGQIIGSEPETMSRSAVILAQHGYDVIDLNFACPVKKIKNKARGGHMLRDVPRAVSILKAVRDALLPHVPATISLRRGFDDSTESVDQFEQIIAAAWEYGYSAVRVHARTVEQKYNGQSRWEFLRQFKARHPDRTILGSGDVFTAEDAVRMLRETGVDIVWIARGAIGNPWIFQQAATLLASALPLPLLPGEGQGEGSSELRASSNPGSPLTLTLSRGERGPEGRGKNAAADSIDRPPMLHPSALIPLPSLSPPSIHAQRDALQEHFAIAMQIHGEQLAGRRMRKMGIKYARFHPRSAEVKNEFINVRSLRDWNAVLANWYSTDGEGIWPDPKAADEVNQDADVTCEVA
jgi:nifR3 family TIM-barrel protein